MYSFLTKNGQTIAFVTGGVLSLIFVFLVMTHGETEGLGPESFSNLTPNEVAEFSSKLTQFDFGLYVTYGLILLLTIVAIGFRIILFILTLIYRPRKAIKNLQITLEYLISKGVKKSDAISTIAIIVGLVLFFFIGKAVAPSVDSKSVMAAAESFNVSESQRGLISGGINLTLIVILVAVGSLIVSEIRNLFK